MRAVASIICLVLIAGCQDPPGITPAPADGSATPDGLPPGVSLLLDAVPPPPGLVRGPHQLRPRPPSPTQVWLNTEGVTVKKGAASDASLLLSYVCGGTFPAFKHGPYGADRAKVVAQLAARVAAFLAPYRVEVVIHKPSAPPYEMVVVGGASSLCGQAKGVAGLAPLDCADKVPGEIAFVFADDLSDLGWLALTAAHEVAHTLGLLHTGEACDIMAPMLCALDKKAFMDGNLPIWPDHQGQCGQQKITNSHRALGLAVGFK
jgi:hypothetical protein